jgi:hypothetical protein
VHPPIALFLDGRKIRPRLTANRVGIDTHANHELMNARAPYRRQASALLIAAGQLGDSGEDFFVDRPEP